MIPIVSSPESLTAFGDTRASSVDTALDLLANRRRRLMLECLGEAGTSAVLTVLAEEIAFEEADTTVSAISDHADVPESEVRSVRLSLHHTHVPKLEEAGAVDYDSATKTVTLTERGETLLSRRESATESPQ